MPGVLRSMDSSSESSVSDGNSGYLSPKSHIRDEYPANSIPADEVKRLDELDPIAVVGMGKSHVTQ